MGDYRQTTPLEEEQTEAAGRPAAGPFTGKFIHPRGTKIGVWTAASYTTHYFSLGVIQNSVDGSQTGTPLYGASNNSNPASFNYTFDGQRPLYATDVLIKYTWAGDTNLDGMIDGTDYSRVDFAYISDPSHPGSVTGWYNGDFNYDGNVTEADYSIIDNGLAGYNASGMTTLAVGQDGNIGVLSILEQLWHWKLPGYAAYYLPIYEENFGQLTTAEYEQALADVRSFLSKPVSLNRPHNAPDDPVGLIGVAYIGGVGKLAGLDLRVLPFEK